MHRKWLSSQMPRDLQCHSCFYYNSWLFPKIQDNYSIIPPKENLFQFHKWERNVIIFRIIEWIDRIPIMPTLQLNFFLHWSFLSMNSQQYHSPLIVLLVWSMKLHTDKFYKGLCVNWKESITYTCWYWFSYFVTLERTVRLYISHNINDSPK